MKKSLVLIIILSIIFSNIPVISLAEEYDSRIPVLKLEDEFGMIEAEDCFYTSSYQTMEMEEASGGIVMKPYGNDNMVRTEEEAHAKYAAQGIDDLTLYFDVEEEGYYTIWLRIYSTSTSHGNYYSHVNNGYSRVQINTPEPWIWGSAETIKFKKGKNLYGMMPRLGSMHIDKILITSSEYYVPMGMGEKPKEFKLGKEGESLQGMFFPLPPYAPPAGHPRLYLNSGNIDKVRANLETPQNSLAWRNLQNVANKPVNCTMDSNAKYSFSEAVHRYLEACAFMYAMDNEKYLSYGQKAIEGLIEYLSTISYNAADSLELARSGIVQFIAKVYDW